MLRVIEWNLSSPNAPHLFFSILSHAGMVRKKQFEKKRWELQASMPLLGELPSPWALPYTRHPLAFLSSLTCLCSLECKIELEQMNGKSPFP